MSGAITPAAASCARRGDLALACSRSSDATLDSAVIFDDAGLQYRAHCRNGALIYSSRDVIENIGVVAAARKDCTRCRDPVLSCWGSSGPTATACDRHAPIATEDNEGSGS